MAKTKRKRHTKKSIKRGKCLKHSKKSKRKSAFGISKSAFGGGIERPTKAKQTRIVITPLKHQRMLHQAIERRSMPPPLPPLTNNNIHQIVHNYLRELDDTYGHISTWDVSRVTNMAGLFANADIDFSLANWNVSNVTNMESMFESAYFAVPTYEGQSASNINHWGQSVQNVTTMYRMFMSSNFNEPLNAWNVSRVQNMYYMFHMNEQFNQPLNAWDVSNVRTMECMFAGNPRQHIFTVFNQPLNHWQVESVSSMQFMFHANSEFNQSLDAWGPYVQNVSNMQYMFSHAINYNQPMNSWRISRLRNINYMFQKATAFNQPLNHWNTATITGMERTFEMATSFNQSLVAWNLDFVQTMNGIFNGATLMEHDQPLTLLKFDTDYPIFVADHLQPHVHTLPTQLTGLDMISGEQKTAQQHLNENPLNIVFYYALSGTIHLCLANKTAIEINCTSNYLKLGCHAVEPMGTIRPHENNVDETVVYFSLRTIGFAPGGLCKIEEIMYVIDHMEESRMYEIDVEHYVQLAAITSMQMLFDDARAIGADHCQRGTDSRVFSILA